MARQRVLGQLASAVMSLPAMLQPASTGIAMPISWVRLYSSRPATGKLPTFLGVTDGGFMADHAQDVGLIPGFVKGIFHGLAIDRQGLVLGPPGLIPGRKRLIQRARRNAHQAIANDKFTGDDIASVLPAAAEAPPGLLFQGAGPIRDGLIAAHAAQDGACRDAQHHRQAMATPLGPPGIGNGQKHGGSERIWSAASMIWGPL